VKVCFHLTTLVYGTLILKKKHRDELVCVTELTKVLPLLKISKHKQLSLSDIYRHFVMILQALDLCYNEHTVVNNSIIIYKGKNYEIKLILLQTNEK
jgi:hypothetical protein